MKKLLFSAFILSVFVSMSAAEIIYLKSGKVVNGKIVSETGDSITVSVSGVSRKIMLRDIDEIASKPRPVPPTGSVKTNSSGEAKTQFSSGLKQDDPDADTYVKDNKSGIIVYDVKETVVEKPATPKAKAAPSPAVADEEFDAAAYLLAGGESGSGSVKIATAAPKEVYQPEPVSDDEYDPALYLLEGEIMTETQPYIANQENSRTKKARVEKERSYASYDKPENETFLAIAFDMKGVNIFSGSVTENGIKSNADLTENADYGISVSAEQYGYVSRFAAIGLGVGFQFKRCLEESPGRFSFLPLYASFKMRFISEEMYHFYAVAHLGYNFLIANYDYVDKSSVAGGLYYAGGLGASYNRYVFQVLYSVNNASMNYSNPIAGDKVDKDIMYSKLGFYVGYLF